MSNERMPWFKWWDGTAADMKFRMIAEDCKLPVASVIGVWASTLARTISTGKIDVSAHQLARHLMMPPGEVTDIWGALEKLGFISGGRVVDWHKRYAGSRKRLCESEWAPVRLRIFERDNYTCRYCGRRGEKLECDHVLPLSRGGTNDDSNLAAACVPCNRSKRNRTVEEWKQAA